MPPSPISDYLSTLRRELRAGDTTERSHYPTLKALIESLAPGITATVEPKWSDWGAPDLDVRKRRVSVRHRESGHPGTVSPSLGPRPSCIVQRLCATVWGARSARGTHVGSEV